MIGKGVLPATKKRGLSVGARKRPALIEGEKRGCRLPREETEQGCKTKKI